MIDAENFVEPARELGFTRYTGVPCSFLTPFINYVINDNTLNYIGSANEGDALATAAGAAMGGEGAVVMMQNSGLGNAVSPITSLTHTFRIPVMIITTHRGEPGLKDEPQHELMGMITGALFDTMQTPWEVFPSEEDQVRPALVRAVDYMHKEQRPYGFLMKKGSVYPHQLTRDPITKLDKERTVRHQDPDPGRTAITRREALKRITAHTPLRESVIIATTGYTGRELFALEDRPNQLYMVGSMGCASSLGLGLALARPDLKIVVIDGDGAALMRMGNFATIGSYGGGNLIHILLDNGVHDSTGAQATVSCNVDFAGIAAACGYGVTYSGGDPAIIDELFENSAAGPRFAHLKIRPGTLDNLPRPDITPADVLQRLMNHIGARF